MKHLPMALMLKPLSLTLSSQYQTRGHQMGLRSGYDLDNIQELLAQLETNSNGHPDD